VNLLPFLLALSSVGQVVLRGDLPPVTEGISKVDISGIAITGEQPQLIGWYQIRRVLGSHHADAEPFLPLAIDLWRGETRLSRGDAPGALPLFERAFNRQPQVPGPTLLFAAEGLAQSRLRTGKIAQAIHPWLVALQLRRSGVTITSHIPDHLLEIESETGLCPFLPPVWIPMPELNMLATTDLSAAIPSADPAVQALWAIYQYAARFELGFPSEDVLATIDERTLELLGIQLALEIVLARTGDSAQRSEAEAQLEARLQTIDDEDSTASWKQAWIQSALGQSYLLETDQALRDRGLLHLIQLPARWAVNQPYLTGIALAELSLESTRRNWISSARTLSKELETTYPWHPARHWLDTQLNRLSHNPSQPAKKEPPQP